MIEVGRVCVKIAGRDAGKKCAIVKLLEDNYVLVDGETRRRKCNVKHLEMLSEKVDIKVDAATKDVCKALSVDFKEKKNKEVKAATVRPRKQRKQKVKENKKPAKEVKKKVATKKAVKKDAGKTSTSTTTE